MLSYLAYLCWNCGQVIRVNPVRKPDAHLDVFPQLSGLGAALPRDISQGLRYPRSWHHSPQLYPTIWEPCKFSAIAAIHPALIPNL